MASLSLGEAKIYHENGSPFIVGACSGIGGAKGEINNPKWSITLEMKFEMISDVRIWKVIVPWE